MNYSEMALDSILHNSTLQIEGRDGMSDTTPGTRLAASSISLMGDSFICSVRGNRHPWATAALDMAVLQPEYTAFAMAR